MNRSTTARVTVVNDCAEICDTFHAILESLGYHIVPPPRALHRDGTDLAPFLSDDGPDVLLYDVSRAATVDWPAVRHLQAGVRARGRRLVLTTTDMRDLEAHGQPLPDTVVLALPCDLEGFAQALQQAVVRRRAVPARDGANAAP